VVPLHQHDAEQITYILEGSLKFELEGKEVVVNPGQVLYIPSNVPHRAVALEDTLDVDVFSPLRMDWINKTIRTCGEASRKKLRACAVHPVDRPAGRLRIRSG